MPDKKIFVYVYGTLRPGGCVKYMVPGVLHNLGWYPGAVVKSPDCGTFFVAEKIEVTSQRLSELDSYENYMPTDPQRSLYLRKPYLDGWIYEYNRPFSKEDDAIEGGDWLKFINEEKGSAAKDVISTAGSNSHSVACSFAEDQSTSRGIDGETGELAA
jgi:gamma-glutamylcyclotransferase (GGCT)/AIG2-like uncharacterized protein YtfP